MEMRGSNYLEKVDERLTIVRSIKRSTMPCSVALTTLTS